MEIPTTELVHVDETRVSASGVTVVVINRAEKKNALSNQVRTRLADAFEDAAKNPRHRVLLLTGAGDVFSAGFDLKEFDQLDGAELWASADRLHRAMMLHPVPVVAAINGPAYAGGADLVTLTDVRVGGDSAVFAHPERQKFPVMYGPLRELVGASMARELVLTGREVEAQEALSIGLLTALVDPGQSVFDEGLNLATDIATSPREILTAMKAKFVRDTAFDAEVTTLAL